MQLAHSITGVAYAIQYVTISMCRLGVGKTIKNVINILKIYQSHDITNAYPTVKFVYLRFSAASTSQVIGAHNEGVWMIMMAK